MRRKMADGGEAESVSPSAMGSGGGKLELTEVLKEQTKVLKQAYSRGSPDQTDLHWPTLSDDLTDVKDVAEFYEAFKRITVDWRTAVNEQAGDAGCSPLSLPWFAPQDVSEHLPSRV